MAPRFYSDFQFDYVKILFVLLFIFVYLIYLLKCFLYLWFV